jgi:hypothetical protein
MSYLNLVAQPAERRWTWWGRVIFYVADVDALMKGAIAAHGTCRSRGAAICPFPPSGLQLEQRERRPPDHGARRTRARIAFRHMVG